MRKRTLAREIAMQALYQYDLLGKESAEDPVEFCRKRSKDGAVFEFAAELVRGVLEHLEEIDAEIKAVAQNWDLTRMAYVDRTILRIGTYELMFREDVPAKVSINEAIELAKRFSTENSGTFVNGVLDKIRMRRGRSPE